MKILSVKVGLPREIFHDGRSIRSGFDCAVRRAAELRALPESWRSYFRDHVEKLTAALRT